ncbi:unnamed protein product, partial [marine sediment metagenome]
SALAAILYVIIFIRPAKKVLLLRPRDRRGKSLTVTQETDLGLVCKPVKKVTHRFIKVGPSWVFHEAGRMVTRFLGLEGTAYTGVVKGDEIVNISLREFLIFLWEEDFYSQIPKLQRDKVETDVIGVTIKVQAIDEAEAGIPTLTADDINDENDNIVLGKIAEPQKASTSQNIMNNLIWLALGAAVMFFASTKGLV